MSSRRALFVELCFDHLEPILTEHLPATPFATSSCYLGAHIFSPLQRTSSHTHAPIARTDPPECLVTSRTHPAQLRPSPRARARRRPRLRLLPLLPLLHRLPLPPRMSRLLSRAASTAPRTQSTHTSASFRSASTPKPTCKTQSMCFEY